MLDAAVADRISFLLKGKTCNHCGDQAERFVCVQDNDIFFCRVCYAGGELAPKLELRIYRSPEDLNEEDAYSTKHSSRCKAMFLERKDFYDDIFSLPEDSGEG